ncbi:hypothetical protein GDO78_000457 [Eleutherodactylus coqui]|uniref:Ribosomal RNA-processing protein 43 n=1 Tax=Eleutherodactylus coqui TaxID=57060 RepID=A0A8J6KFG3_ELECQ|nr:hypothetical protein GDO78_000457 [Eleutherodactylus coqui]
MAAGYKTVEPLEYYRKFLKQSCRPDGRGLSEFRITTINVGSITTADGSALVKLGNCTVICGIKAEFANPAADAPDKGYIVPNVDLTPLCSSRFRPGPPGEEAQVASQFIADLTWVLYCDLICLDYDGNLLDACVCALVAALRNVQLPSVKISEDTGLAQVDLSTKSPLKILKKPVSTSFAVLDDTYIVVDPTDEEESLATGLLTVVTDEDGKLCTIRKPGGSSLSAERLQECISRAVSRHKEVQALLDEVLLSVKTL